MTPPTSVGKAYLTIEVDAVTCIATLKSMKLTFQPMTLDYAEQMLGWKYEAPYERYSYDGEDPESALAYLTDPENQFFAVLMEGVQIGFRSFGADGQVEGGRYDEFHVDMGGGLKPEYTGKGFGEIALRAGLKLGQEILGTHRFRVTVAAFNERALKVVKRVGFREVERFLRPDDQEEFVVLVKHLEPSD